MRGKLKKFSQVLKHQCRRGDSLKLWRDTIKSCNAVTAYTQEVHKYVQKHTRKFFRHRNSFLSYSFLTNLHKITWGGGREMWISMMNKYLRQFQSAESWKNLSKKIIQPHFLLYTGCLWIIPRIGPLIFCFLVNNWLSGVCNNFPPTRTSHVRCSAVPARASSPDAQSLNEKKNYCPLTNTISLTWRRLDCFRYICRESRQTECIENSMRSFGLQE